MWRLFPLLFFLFLLAGCHHSMVTFPHLREGTPPATRHFRYSVCGDGPNYQYLQAVGVEAWNQAYSMMDWQLSRTSHTCSPFNAHAYFKMGECDMLPPDQQAPDVLGCALLSSSPSRDWDAVQGYIELTPYWESWSGWNEDGQITTVVHEWGHVLGLLDHFTITTCDVFHLTGQPTVMARSYCHMTSPDETDLFSVVCRYGFTQYCSSSFGGAMIMSPQPDYDADGVPDADDNCVQAVNTLQQDRDRDGDGDACDSDEDNDGFTDAVEVAIGTDRGDSCRDNTSHDAWPPDVNMNGVANTVDVGRFVPHLNTRIGEAKFNKRLDLNNNDRVNTLDIGLFVPVLNKSCISQDSQLLDVVKSVEAYADWTVAAQDGFEWRTNFKNGYGMTMVRDSKTDDVFSLTEPEGLIYRYDTGGFERLAGVFWLMPEWWSDPPPSVPDPFIGSGDVWRSHPNFCINEDTRVWSEGVAESNCNGVHWDAMGKILIAWTHKANPNGIFTEYNPSVTWP